VKWTRGTQNADVVDQRGRRGGAARLTGGGLAAAVVVVLVAQLFGVDVSGLIGGGGGAPPSQSQPPAGADPDEELVGYVKFVMKDIQDTFEAMFEAEGRPYRRAKLYLFTGAIDTGCGRSSAAIGPFYCPADQHAYIDLSFYRELKQRFGAPGDFAQAYVLAHEVGHHLQKLMETGSGSMAEARGGGGRNERSVRTELQADCFAGVWGHAAAGKRLLEAGDLEEALTAATAIGDDHLQHQAGGEVHPETFTHGSSAQRVRWFRRGFDSGRFAACDTFAASAL
jgi:hypothetical protein